MTKTKILDSNPFASPPIAEVGSRSKDEIYLAVGRALDNWEMCEARFGVLFVKLAKPEGGHQQIMRSFGTVTAPAGRREMISAASEAYFYSVEKLVPQLKTEALELEKKVRMLLNLHQHAAARRNEIAHGSVRGAVSKGTTLPSEYFLVPGIFATRKTNKSWADVKYKYSAIEISSFAGSVNELGNFALLCANSIGLLHKALPQKCRESLA